ncbi:hypothetical protein Lser_V15G00380 [Lactuca serriola]
MKEEESIESRVQQAMHSRVQHFRDLADSLTFEGARRLLEKDLALDTYALDKHKKYVKQLLEKLLSDTEAEDNVSKQIKSEKVKKEEEVEVEEQKVTVDDEDKVEDSPVMGLLSGNKSAKSEKPKTQDKIPTEDMIKKAIWKKATYFQSKSEELTVAGVRRLIEEDLELEKFSLDPFKKLISKQLDEVLNSQNDTPNKSDDADSSHSESEEKEVEVKPKKKSAPKTKPQKSEAPKKRKKPAQETEQPKKKKMKNAEETSVKKKNVKDADGDSSGEKSESSAEKTEKKEVIAPVYGKKVERLKSIIKACGMIVAPTVYRKAKQAPEEQREAILVKELKEILSKEGLSSNPSEKEIKEVKRRKEKAKELEGIDTSNIVVGSRRRSTFNFVAPPKPKVAIESDGDESSEDSDDDSEDSDNEDADGDDQEEGDDKDGDDKNDDEEGGDDDKDDADDKNDDDQGGDGDDDDDGKNEDEDNKVDESKSEEVTGNDEMV